MPVKKPKKSGAVVLATAPEEECFTPLPPEEFTVQKKRMESAASWIVFNEPFWTALYYLLAVSPDYFSETMCTNGKDLFWNPHFVKKLTDPELRFCILHEVAHCAYRHIVRRGLRDPLWFNIAGDEEINLSLHDHYGKDYQSKLVTMPKGCLLDHKYTGWTVERIYDDIEKNSTKITLSLDKDGRIQVSGSGPRLEEIKKQLEGKQLVGQVKETPGGPAVQEQTQETWKQTVLQAAASCKGRGRLPALAERLVAEIREGRKPWQHILREFMLTLLPTDHSWNRINRRYMGSGFLLPGLGVPAMKAVVLAVDTSGSVDGPLLNRFLAELRSLMLECKPVQVHVVSCDAAVHDHHQLDWSDELPAKYKGGGGTDFTPVFKWIEKQRETEGLDLACLVYFTDGMGSFPRKEPDYPVLWALSENTEVPFGTSIFLHT